MQPSSICLVEAKAVKELGPTEICYGELFFFLFDAMKFLDGLRCWLSTVVEVLSELHTSQFLSFINHSQVVVHSYVL